MDDFLATFGLMNLNNLQQASNIVFTNATLNNNNILVGNECSSECSSKCSSECSSECSFECSFECSSECSFESDESEQNTDLKDKIISELNDLKDIKPPYGCKHYLRRCKLIAACCNKQFYCRLCHDEAKNTETITFDEQHYMDRKKVEKIVCTNCNMEQKIQQYCEECGIYFGMYFCGICRLFDDIDKDQYHCDKCGFCRIGKDQNFHCDGCNICLNKKVKEIHECIDLKGYDCPICMDPIFTSTRKSMPLKCNHWMHHNCLIDYLKTNYKCPICSASVCDMTEYNKLIDLEIQQTPMPDEYKDMKIKILCNDCHEESEVLFHVVANKCLVCRSYNTRHI